jgi:nicotinamidase-related amidase
MRVPRDASLLVIDVQGRLVPAIAEAEPMIANVRRLVSAACILKRTIAATEQNPKGLGPTMAGLVPPKTPVFEKQSFDSTLVTAFADWAEEQPAIVVCGMEAHVCVLQTVLGLIELDVPVFLVRDAVGSRTLANRDAAVERMGHASAEIITTEMAIFEWLEHCERPEFKDVLALVK